MARTPRESTERRAPISIRLKPQTLRVLEERARLRGLPVGTYIADYLDRAAEAYL